MALLTTTIGSFPQPAALHEARRRFAEGELDAAALRSVEDAAVERVIALQEEAGVSLLVDGEIDRADPVASYAERLAGVEIAGWVRVYGDRYVRKPKIVGAVARGGSSTVDRFLFASRRAKGPVKAVVPGPYTLMDGSFDEHYGSRRKVCEALIEIVTAEVAGLAAAGAAEIQLDEPSAGVRDDELPMLHDALLRCLAPAKGRARTWVYLGYADLARHGAALAALPADGLLVAGAHCGYAGLESFAKALPGDRFAGVGVIDTLDPEVETADRVAARIAVVARLIPADRLWAVPDGGFRAVTEGVAARKLAAMVAAAAA